MSRRVIRRTKRVAEDIVDIYRFIYVRNPQAADRVLATIEQSIRSLVDTPGVGRYWNSPDPRLSGMKIATVRPYRNYLIFFRAVSDAIEVFRVVHGARELAPLIDEIEFDFDDGDGGDSKNDPMS